MKIVEDSNAIEWNSDMTNGLSDVNWNGHQHQRCLSMCLFPLQRPSIDISLSNTFKWKWINIMIEDISTSLMESPTLTLCLSVCTLYRPLSVKCLLASVGLFEWLPVCLRRGCSPLFGRSVSTVPSTDSGSVSISLSLHGLTRKLKTVLKWRIYAWS